MTGDSTPLYNNQPEIEAFKEIIYRQLDRVFDLDREQSLSQRWRWTWKLARAPGTVRLSSSASIGINRLKGQKNDP